MSDEEVEKLEEQEKYRNMKCRMYENEFPQKNDLVYVSPKISNLKFFKKIKLVQNNKTHRNRSLCSPFRIRQRRSFI